MRRIGFLCVSSELSVGERVVDEPAQIKLNVTPALIKYSKPTYHRRVVII
jgi:hypothetical protein